MEGIVCNLGFFLVNEWVEMIKGRWPEATCTNRCSG